MKEKTAPMFKSLLLSATLVLGTQSALAHEFWISPQSYLIKRGEQVKADLRVGQNFEGAAYSFRPSGFETFNIVADDRVFKVPGRLGDIPALQLETPADGLLVVVHETKDNSLTYTEWPKFVKFAEHKAFPTTLEDHEARGISKEKFVERYRRYAKSMVAVGDGAGNDRQVGMKTEIVALANPYTDAITEMPIQVFLDQEPRVDAQIEVFEKSPDDVVEISLYRTNNQGIANIPVKPGFEYLFDAVAMIPLENSDPDKGPVWWSLWAALTFLVPEQPLSN